MLFFQTYNQSIAKFLVSIFLLSQVLTFGSMFIAPKPAQAFLGFGDLTIKIGDVYDVLKDVGLGALRQVALQVSNKFLTKLTSKLQEKYKIRNYLYYDQILTSYYLNNFINDKVDDPNLRQIYGLLAAGFITGDSTGTTNQPNRSKALIPRLKQAISDYYVSKGGIDPTKIYNPGSFSSDREYFAAAESYFYNMPSYTESNLRAEFGAMQSAATTAAQLEVTVGNGLKAGRVIGGTCNLPEGPTSTAPESWLMRLGFVKVAQAQTAPLEATPNNNFTPLPGSISPNTPSNAGSLNQTYDPNTCQAVGGTWSPSALDRARSFIDNPTASVASWLDGAIHTHLKGNFDPNSFWAVIGSLVGNIIFNQLTLDKSEGGLIEDPNYNYTPNFTQPSGGSTFGLDGISVGTPIYLDGDTIIDAYDTDNDGQPDICVYGGLSTGSRAVPGPPCKPSSNALDTPPPCSINVDLTNSVTNTVDNSISSDPTGNASGSATGTASGSANATINENCPEPATDGGGACASLFNSNAPHSLRDEVQAAVASALAQAESSGLADLPATDQGNIEAFRDLVIAALQNSGLEASTTYNGNCNVARNSIGVRTPGATNGESYDVVRHDNNATIEASTSFGGRPSFLGAPPWDFITTGNR